MNEKQNNVRKNVFVVVETAFFFYLRARTENTCENEQVKN